MPFDFGKAEYASGSGTEGDIIKENEKNILIANGVALPVKAIGRAVTQFGPRFAVQVDLEGADRVLMFPSDKVQSRVNLLTDLEAYVNEGNTDLVIKLVKEGRRIDIVEA